MQYSSIETKIFGLFCHVLSVDTKGYFKNNNLRPAVVQNSQTKLSKKYWTKKIDSRKARQCLQILRRLLLAQGSLNTET